MAYSDIQISPGSPGREGVYPPMSWMHIVKNMPPTVEEGISVDVGGCT
jgi:hypothetical protein